MRFSFRNSIDWLVSCPTGFDQELNVLFYDLVYKFWACYKFAKQRDGTKYLRFQIEHFEVTSRVVTGNGMRMLIEAAGKGMLERGEI